MFDLFREMYPRKVGKRAAEKKYKQLVKEGAIEKEIYNGLRKYMNHWGLVKRWIYTSGDNKGKPKKDGGQYIPHPSTRLHQGRWTDEVEVPKKKDTKEKNSDIIDKKVKDLVKGKSNRNESKLRALFL